jgi:hypothetical protein
VASGAATNQIGCVCNSISKPKRSGLATSGESHSDVEVLGCENINGAITESGNCNNCPSDFRGTTSFSSLKLLLSLARL